MKSRLYATASEQWKPSSGPTEGGSLRRPSEWARRACSTRGEKAKDALSNLADRAGVGIVREASSGHNFGNVRVFSNEVPLSRAANDQTQSGGLDPKFTKISPAPSGAKDVSVVMRLRCIDCSDRRPS
jgi:hypothetical protein